MEWLGIVVLIFTFFTLMFVGVPISYSIGIASLCTLLVSLSFDVTITTVAQRMTNGLNSFSLLAIPFFVLAGHIMNKGGIALRLIEFAKIFVGRYPGGLFYINILACMLFGAISGSAVAAASAIGGVMLPIMYRENYNKGVAVSTNLTSATTGMLIPPSNILIIYSLASGGVSIASLFIAGYLPGILLGASIAVIAAIHVKKNGYPQGQRIGLKEAFKKFVDALWTLSLLIIIIGGILSGIFTATEASAIAVIYTLFISLFIHKEMKWTDLKEVLLGSIKTTSVILLLIATSYAMSWSMSFENIPQLISEGLINLSDNVYVILLLINIILLMLGVFMDMTPAVLIFTPIFLPVVSQLGVDPIHFGVIMVLNLSIGLCTPPVGNVLFIGAMVGKLKITEVIKPITPFFLAMIIVLLLVTFFPALSLWLPNLLGL